MTLRPGILLRREKGQPEGHAVKGKAGKLRVAGTDRKTWNAAAVSRLKPAASKIIPGDWEKAESGWLARPLLSRIARFGSGGRIHQFLWRRSRAVSNAK
jgi:hypothetical protein